jgi:hypothetical protein
VYSSARQIGDAIVPEGGEEEGGTHYDWQFQGMFPKGGQMLQDCITKEGKFHKKGCVLS